MSIATKSKKKRTVGGGGGADSKIVSELQLNVKKLLEDMRKIKNFEHESGLTFRKIDQTFENLKQKSDLIEEEQAKIRKRNEEIESEHASAMGDLAEKTKKVAKIYNDIQKMVGDFKKEYRYGFKKIIKAEVDINDLLNQVKFIKTKILPKNQQKQLNKADLIKEIDGKFEIMYEQVASMASEQANFNIKIQNDQNKLQEPLEIEISKIRQESDLMMRELERTQKANRELMNGIAVTVQSERSPAKYNSFIKPNTAMPSNRAHRKASSSFIAESARPSRRQIRHSTPSTSAVPMSRLKRFRVYNKQTDDSIPDFSHLIKRKVNNRSKANKSVMEIDPQPSTDTYTDLANLLNYSTRANVKTAEPR